jgi:hypothetical protein
VKNFWKKAAAAAIIIGIATAAYFHFVPHADTSVSPQIQYYDSAGKEEGGKNKKTEKKDAKSALQALLGALITAVQAVLVFIVSLCVKIAGGLAVTAFSKIISGPLHIILTFILDTAVFFILIFLLFGLIYKKMYPKRKLRSFYTKRNILYMLLAAAILAALKTAAGFFMHRLRIIAAAAQCVLSLAVIAFLWYKVYGMHGGAKKIGRTFLGSAPGKILTAGLAAWAVLAAAVKIWIEKSAMLRTGADLLLVFLLCAGIWYCFYKVRDFRQQRLHKWIARNTG